MWYDSIGKNHANNGNYDENYTNTCGDLSVSWNRVWIPPTQYSEHNYPEPAINDLLDNLDSWNSGDYSSYQNSDFTPINKIGSAYITINGVQKAVHYGLCPLLLLHRRRTSLEIL